MPCETGLRYTRHAYMKAVKTDALAIIDASTDATVIF
jgi:hypothetical protein